MGECPSPLCAKNQAKLIKDVDILKVCFPKKVSWQSLAWTLGGVIIPIIAISAGFLTYSMASEKKQNDEIAKVKVLETKIQDIEKTTDRIDCKIDRLDEKVHKIERNQLTPMEYKKLLREALREFREKNGK